MQHAGELVDRRVLRALLVLVVEPGELPDQHPDRQRGQEDQRLERAVELRAVVAEDRQRDEERRRQARDVGQHERSPHQPATPRGSPAVPPLLEDLERARIERSDELGGGHAARASPSNEWTAIATRSISSALSDGCIGSDRTRSASDSATGSEPRPKPAGGVGARTVDRHGVVHAARDPVGVQMRAQGVALLGQDHVLVPDVIAAGGGRRRSDHRRAGQHAGQCGGGGAAALVDVVEPAQLHAQDRRLEGVEPRGGADHVMVVAGPLAVRAQQPDLVGDRRVVRHEPAAVAPGAEVLRGVEGEAAGVAHRARATAGEPGAVRLAGVLDDGDALGPRQLEDRVEVERAPVEMDGDHRARARRDRALDQLGRDERGARIDVDEARRRARQRDRLGGRDERVRRHDHLVAAADAERAQRQHQGFGARGDADGVRRAAVPRELLLEGLDLGAERERRAARDPLDLAQQLVHERRVGVVHSGQRDGCGAEQPRHAATAIRGWTSTSPCRCA